MVAAPLLRLEAAFLRRRVDAGGCWKLAVAAMLPGGLAIAAALTLYASRGFRLLDFVLAFALAHGLHVVLMLGAVFALPKSAPVSPFAEPPSPPPVDEPAEAPAAEPSTDLERSPFAAPKPARTGNPFAPGGSEVEVAPEPEKPEAAGNAASPPAPQSDDSQPLNPS
jgi:hypothetical protein